MAQRILLVEDDPNLSRTLEDLFANQDYAVKTAWDGPTAVTEAAGGAYDLLLLDVQLPGKDGFAVCSQLREMGIQTPVMMLSARSESGDKIRGLRAGADDYVTKPFDASELLARMEAVLRRAQTKQVAALLDYRFGSVHVDFFRARAIKASQPVSLSLKELHLLRYLISRKGATLSRDELLREVWGYQSTNTRTVDMHVATLRQKLEDDPKQPRFIATVRGEGYSFRD